MRATARLWIGGLFASFCTLVAAADAPGVPTVQFTPLRSAPMAKGLRAGSDAKVDATLLAAARAVTAPANAISVAPDYVQSFIAREVGTDGTISVVIHGHVSDELVAAIQAAGARDVKDFRAFGQVTAQLPASALSALAQREDVGSIGPREVATVNRYIPEPGDPLYARAMAKSGATNWQGVVAHQADVVQAAGIRGAGVKICVISDGVNSLASRQAAGELPAVLVLPGQAGAGDEGTAMLEILYDMAPGASLAFATGFSGQGQTATNIINLRASGCDIIVDDVSYLNEVAFQDDAVARAINQVTTQGALYFSSAGNSGNLANVTGDPRGGSGTWEGDFVPYPDVPAFVSQFYGRPVQVANFNGLPYLVLTKSTQNISLKWSDPTPTESSLIGSSNDYDLIVTDAAETGYYCALGLNSQTGTERPVELIHCSSGVIPAGAHIYVIKYSGQARAIRVDTHRGLVQGGTNGSTFGHNAAASAVTVAAVNLSSTPIVFTNANTVSFYSSDGPRRMFYNANGSEITPGNLLFGTGGGQLLSKVDLAAGDCGSTTTPGLSSFCGTSAAAPTAAAIAALVKSARPSASAAQVLNALKTTAIDIEAPGFDVDSGSGILLAPAAVRALLQPLAITRGFSSPTVVTGHLVPLVTAVTNSNGIAMSGLSIDVRFPAVGMGALGTLSVTGSGCSGIEADEVNGFLLANVTIPANTTCTFSMPVYSGQTTGTYSTGTNTVSQLLGLTSTAPSATITVTPPPPLVFSVLAASVLLGDTAVITANVPALPGGPLGSLFDFSTAAGPIAGCSGVAFVTSGAGGTAACSTNTLAAGPQTITVTYRGDSNYAPTSHTASMVVQIATTTAVTSSAPSSLNTQTVTFFAVVNGTTGVPSGTVQFRSDGTVINGCAAIALVLQGAKCSTGTLAPGSHLITAVYLGSSDGTFLGSTGTTSQSVDTATPPPPAPGKRLDFNGDGTTDLAWQLADGSLSLWLELNGTIIGRGMVLGPAPGSVTKSADFNGDGKADLVRQLADGSATMYLMNGIDAVATAPLLAAGSGWHLLNVGDFNGDGKADLLWQHDDGSVQIWLMNGTTVSSTTTVMGPNAYWTPAKLGDFNGDGKTDILWVNVDGTTSIWLMDGATRTTGSPIMGAGSGWHVTHVADFNADGKSDLIWQHDGDGAVSMWLMDGLTVTDKGPLMPANSGWSVMQVGHLTNDAMSDIVWVNVDGTVSAWIMQGRTILRRGQLMPAASGWSVAQVIDTSGNSVGELVWTHTSGSVGLWSVDWATTTNGAFTPSWKIPLLGAGTPWAPATSLEQNR